MSNLTLYRNFCVAFKSFLFIQIMCLNMTRLFPGISLVFLEKQQLSVTMCVLLLVFLFICEFAFIESQTLFSGVTRYYQITYSV